MRWKVCNLLLANPSMKKFYLFIIFLASFMSVKAAHIVGGEVVYNFLSKTATTTTYQVTVILFRDNLCTGCAVLPLNVSIGIFSKDNGRQVGNYISISRNNEDALSVTQSPPCLVNAPNFNYSGGYYTTTVTLDNNQAGYAISYQTCCRVNGIANLTVRQSGGGGGQGATYSTNIPGQNVLANLLNDNSARFQTGISIICYNKKFTLDFSASDADGDSLFYEFVEAYEAFPATDASFSTPESPPYSSVSYSAPYSDLQPLGGGSVVINSATGIITGTAPANAGKYVVAVQVSSYRNGVLLDQHRKDFLVTVSPCDFSSAELDLSYSNCKDSTFTFVNNNNSPNNLTFFWDFGDGSTSTEQMPVHTYADTGAYTIKLVINAGTACSDSSTAPLIVFPTFRTGFSDSSPACKNTAVIFRDSSVATYGPVNSWSWDFGDRAVGGSNNTANTSTTSHSYASSGTYKVTLISTSVKGCRDTLSKLISIVEKPVFTVGNDTLICIIDTLQLKAVGVTATNGIITWTPNYNINNVNSFSPLVSPDVTTTYTATYTDNSGCFASESVTINVVNDVTVMAMADTTICRTDSLRLNVVTDGLSFSWTPVALLSNPKLKNPLAFPTAASTTFRITASIGKCSKFDDVVVTTVPYPAANAGNDTTVCFGANIPLFATGGSNYSWSPTFFLTDPNIRNPISIAPPRTLEYVVTVTDILGCPKAVKDTIKISVIRLTANAGPRDTAIVLNQPLQLNATGGQFYVWTPTTFLNNANIPNPISNPTDSVTYYLTVSDSTGCFARDTITVRVFRLVAGLYVPTAFTPNGNGVNDVFRPIALGIRSLEYFKIYNRWGELVFETSELGKGWNGSYKGREQGTSAFVWEALATDYTGKRIFKKGSVVLIK